MTVEVKAMQGSLVQNAEISVVVLTFLSISYFLMDAAESILQLEENMYIGTKLFTDLVVTIIRMLPGAIVFAFIGPTSMFL